MRVLIAGFQHETNTFAPTPADWAAFNAGDSVPAVTVGPAMVAIFEGLNMPVSGFMAAAREHGWQLLPSMWAGATPSSLITADAFERIAGAICGDAHEAMHAPGGLDAIYLDLHGAAVAEQADDAEGELLARLRERVGTALPIVASLDLHANVSERMLALADALVPYRTYPHVDMADTGRLAARLLAHRLQRGQRQPLAWRRLPYLIPVTSQSTWRQPARGVYEDLRSLEAPEQAGHGSLHFCMGFGCADIADCAPMLWAYADDEALAHRLADALHERAAPPAQWAGGFLSPREAVQRALERTDSADRHGIGQGVVLIADVQDNPGGGGDSNTTGLLHELLRQRAGHRLQGRVALGLICDPAAAQAAQAAGVGAELNLELGSSVRTFDGTFSEAPVSGRFTVERLSDGVCTYLGPMMTGVTSRLGPAACLSIDGVQVAVVSGKMQLLDRELLRMVGIEPEAMRLIVLKSANHFRADFGPLVADAEQDILIAKAPGPMAADPADLPWTRLRVSAGLPV